MRIRRKNVSSMARDGGVCCTEGAGWLIIKGISSGPTHRVRPDPRAYFARSSGAKKPDRRVRPDASLAQICGRFASARTARASSCVRPITWRSLPPEADISLQNPPPKIERRQRKRKRWIPPLVKPLRLPPVAG
jgi:hypothetical protein